MSKVMSQRQQRVAQVAGADDDDLVAAVDAQNVADLGAQLRHVVTVALLAEFAEAAEILADLGGGLAVETAMARWVSSGSTSMSWASRAAARNISR